MVEEHINRHKLHPDAAGLVMATTQDIPSGWLDWLKRTQEIQAQTRMQDWALAASIPTVLVVEMLKDGIDLIRDEDPMAAKRAIKWLRQNGHQNLTTPGNIL